MTCITIFLTDFDHPRVFRGVISEADAIGRIRTAKVVQINMPTVEGLGALDQVFAVCNSVTDGSYTQRDAEQRYRSQQARSLSVGDVIHIEGLGIYSVEGAGWKRLDHRLTVNAAASAVRRVSVTFDTPEGETVTLSDADVARWADEREGLSNHGAAKAARAALAAKVQA